MDIRQILLSEPETDPGLFIYLYRCNFKWS